MLSQGAPHPVLFGALTAVAAMIPFLAPLAFGAVTDLLAMQGEAAAGVAVAIVTLCVPISSARVRLRRFCGCCPGYWAESNSSGWSGFSWAPR